MPCPNKVFLNNGIREAIPNVRDFCPSFTSEHASCCQHVTKTNIHWVLCWVEGLQRRQTE